MHALDQYTLYKLDFSVHYCFNSMSLIKSIFNYYLPQVKLSSVISTSEARGSVEKWLLQVEQVMIVSIRDVIEVSRLVGCWLCHCGLGWIG